MSAIHLGTGREMDGNGFLEKQAATKGTANFIISVFCLKKKCWGLQPLLQATLKKNIIDTFSRGSFLLMGGGTFSGKKVTSSQQRPPIFCFKLIKGGSSSTSTAPCLASRRKRKPGRVGSCLPARWRKKICLYLRVRFAMCAMVQSRYCI